MSQGWLRFVKFLAVLGIIYFALWGLQQMRVDYAPALIRAASWLPGLQDLPDKYELGDKRKELFDQRGKELQARKQALDELDKKSQTAKQREENLQQRENALKEGQNKLIHDQQTLIADRSNFNNEKDLWLGDHPGSNKSAVTQSSNSAIPGVIDPQLTSDAKIKEYLSMLGKMKPKQAAMVIQKLPEATVFTIFDQLNHFQVIKIMENLPEDYLAKLTQDRLNKYRDFK